MLPQQRVLALEIETVKELYHKCTQMYQHTIVHCKVFNVCNVLKKATVCVTDSQIIQSEKFTKRWLYAMYKEKILKSAKKCTKCRKKESAPKRGILSRESDL